jgi:V/A-type H+/Na+-transporting ATPase subunit B
MPGNDVTHPVPDNTGYITEGQFYLHDGMIDPFGSLSRLKQQVIGSVTREDHSQVMNTMIRLFSGARDAQKKQQMAFDLSPFDEKLLSSASCSRRGSWISTFRCRSTMPWTWLANDGRVF